MVSTIATAILAGGYMVYPSLYPENCPNQTVAGSQIIGHLTVSDKSLPIGLSIPLLSPSSLGDWFPLNWNVFKRST